MKKSHLSILAVSVILASCTMPTMPWSKTKTDNTEEVILADAMNSSGEVPVKSDDTKPESDETPKKDIIPTDTPKNIAEGGVYLPYTSTAVAQAKGNVVLYFHANWNPTCININKDIEKNLKNIPKNLTILKVNFDEATELKELYDVSEQYTFVQVNNFGKMIKKWRGGSTFNEILGQIEGLKDSVQPQDFGPPEPPAKKL